MAAVHGGQVVTVFGELGFEAMDVVDGVIDGDELVDGTDPLNPDSDGDGYGNPFFVIQLCEQPLNYVSNAEDCNDTDFYVHPEDQVLHASEFEDDGVTPYVHRERCNGKVELLLTHLIISLFNGKY